MRKLGLIGALLAVGLPFSGGALDVSGTIAADTQWGPGDSPVRVVGDVTVAPAATLTIEAGVSLNLQANRRLTVDGALNAAGVSIAFGAGADMVVNGQAEFEACAFDGYAAVLNAEDLIFSETSSGGLSNCTLHDLNLMIASHAVALRQGAAENTFGPVVHLAMTAGESPIITGVDFTDDPDWLSVLNMTWFVDALAASLSEKITDNLFAATGRVSVGLGDIGAPFHFARQLPFSGPTLYEWTWAGGAITAGTSVVIDPQVHVVINGGVSVDGALEVSPGALLETRGAVALAGALTVKSGGEYAFLGNSASAAVTGILVVESLAEARLDGNTVVSGQVRVDEEAALRLGTMLVSSGGVLNVGAGAVLEIGYAGLTVEGTWSASGATIQLGAPGGITIRGDANVVRCGFLFHMLSVMTVQDGGLCSATQCGFSGPDDPDNVDGLIFEAGSSGGLSGCTFENVRLALGGPGVSMMGGSITNANGPALMLTQTSGDAPAVSGVDFSGEPDWLYAANTSWFFQEWEASLADQFTGNACFTDSVISLGPSDIKASVALTPTLPFSGAATYAWEWEGGTIIGGVALTVPDGVSLTVAGPLTVAGELLVQPGAWVDTLGETNITGRVHVWGDFVKTGLVQARFLGNTRVAGTLRVNLNGWIEAGPLTIADAGTLAVESGGLVDIRSGGITVQPRGALNATDATVKFLESGSIFIHGDATLTRSLVDIYNYNDIEVYGVLKAVQTVLEGAYPGTADSLIFHAGSNGQFDLCRILDMTVEMAGRGVFDRCIFTNRDGSGLVVSTGALLAVSRSNLTDIAGYAIQSAPGTDVTAARCYWGAADGPSGEGFSGSGEPVSGPVSVTNVLPEALVFAPGKLLSHTPSGLVTRAVRQVMVTFSGMINPATFNWVDVVLVGPSGEFYATNITQEGVHDWRIEFPEKTAEGNYFFRVGPNVQNMAGFGLDQNGDGLTGDPILDVYTGTFTIGYPPVAAFSASETIICAGASVTFTNQSTNNPSSFSWNFGDGGTATGASVTHQYAAKGVYDVTLTAANAYGQDVITKTALVQVETPPMANLTTDITSGNAPVAVNFSNLTEGTVDSWFWDFGDGQTSTVAGPGGHIYANPGNYTVVLRAANRCGFTTDAVVIEVAAVLPPPAPTELTASDGTDCLAVFLSWRPSDTADYYRVYRDGVALPTTTLTTYTDQAIQPGLVHTYVVRAFNVIGGSANSEPDTGFRGAPGLAPESVSATDGALAQAIRITWNAAPGALQYRVYRNTTDAQTGAAPISDWLPAGTVSFDDADTTAPVVVPATGCNGKETIDYTYYYYWVTAKYVCGESRAGNPDSGYRGLAPAKK